MLLAKREARRLNMAGCLFLRLNNPTEARSRFAAAIGASPGVASYHFNLGVAIVAVAALAGASGDDGTKLDDQAAASFATSLRIDPKFLPAAANFAAIHIKHSRPSQAVECLCRSLCSAFAYHLDDTTPGSLDVLTTALEGCEDVLEAIKDATGDNSSGLRAFANLATAVRAQGQHLSAVTAWRRWLGLGSFAFSPSEVPAAAATSSAHSAPTPKDACCTSSIGSQPTRVVVVCMKWGSKYGSDYVYALRRAVERGCKDHWRFGDSDSARRAAAVVCVTDDESSVAGSELASTCGVVQTLPLATFGASEASGPLDTRADVWPHWWHKTRLFAAAASQQVVTAAWGLSSAKEPAVVLFLDLDVIISGSLEPIVDGIERGRPLGSSSAVTVLGTDGLACEGRLDGINSSLVGFVHDPAGSVAPPPWQIIFDAYTSGTLRLSPALLVHRFDHWLELFDVSDDAGSSVPFSKIICGAAGHVCDYATLAAAGGSCSVPVLPSLVVFPLKPKPHEISHDERLFRQWNPAPSASVP